MKHFAPKNTILLSSVTAILFFGVAFIFNPAAALIGLLGMLVITLLFALAAKARYSAIANVSFYVRSILNGEKPVDITDNQEGELGVLKTEIGKITSKLSYQATYLTEEKQRMADALSNISHQMKTPLAAISIMVDLLENPSLPPEKQKEFLYNIRAAQHRMQWQVEALLKMAKIDAGAIVLQRKLCTLTEVIHIAAEPVSILMELKNQTLSLEEHPESTLSCDKNWTAEALANILKNCAEHTEEGGEIKVAQGENPLYYWISVTGGGAGIPKEDLPHIFKRFYKGKNSDAESTGIGLSMSLLILQKQNGDIEVANIPGGVQFTLKLYKM